MASQVTIHQLLTHTGGTGDIFGPEFDAHRLELRTLQDYVKQYGNRTDWLSPPGSQWEYSNYGFVLARPGDRKGERRRAITTTLREHIYEPAGMTATGSEPEDEAVPGRSTGYTAGCRR